MGRKPNKRGRSERGGSAQGNGRDKVRPSQGGADAERKRPALFDEEVDEEIDLHGMSLDEAMAQVEMAFERWRQRPGACLRIIHGHSTPGKDSIKATLRRNLETAWRSRVQAFKNEFANPGATLIRLRRA